MIRNILDRLREQNEHGRFKAYGGTALADAIDSTSGQNSVSGAITGFRKQVAAQLLDEMNIKVEARDVIETTNRGYCLTQKISVRDADDPVNDPQSDPGHDLGHRKDDPLNDLANDPDEFALNDRQAWIMEHLKAGVRLRISQVEERFKCSNSTAKRDLTALRQRGKITFSGSSRTGYYVLKH